METRILFIVYLVLTTILYPQTKEKKNTTPEMIKVEGGTFDMGATPNLSEARFDEVPAHQVTVGSFLIGKTELTVGQFKEFIDATGYKTSADEDGGSYIWFGGKDVRLVAGVNWSRDTKGEKRLIAEMNHPVIHISWYDATEYCNWLSKKESLTLCYSINRNEKDPNNKSEYDKQKWIVNCDFEANGYRLPTEAEWEYAARGGKKSKGYKYSGSNDMKEAGWFGAVNNSGNRTLKEGTSEVGKKTANELGIFDMSGNVWEWVWDWYGKKYYGKTEKCDPKGETSGINRVLRGGSWSFDTEYCRLVYRFINFPDYRNVNFGAHILRTN